VIFDENGPLYIFIGETEGFCYFQVENDEYCEDFSNHRQYQKTLRNRNNLTVTGFSVLSANFP